MSASTDYDLIPYDDRPVAQTHPDRLWVAARAAGFEAVAPERARILELGCAHGVNLAPIAAALPEARVLGVDLSPRQIELGRRRLASLELDNLELRCADVTSLDLGEERFDYIIAHGLFSWVPEGVRERILALCRDHLTERGLAYLSYNTMPTWGVRGAVRVALREATADAREPSERLRLARAALAELATIRPLAGTAEDALLAAEIEELLARPDAYLLHEYLCDEGRAFWFRELVDLARGASLEFLTDVAPLGIEREAAAELRARLSREHGDPLAVEQLLDVVTFRQFRASLLCHRASAPVPREIADLVGLLRQLHLAAPPAGADEPATTTPELAAAIAWLREQWPADRTLSELAEACALAPETLATQLAALITPGPDDPIELRPRSLSCGRARDERPRVAAITRLEAEQLPFVTTWRHECAPLDALHAAIVRGLDGSRDRGGLVERVIGDIESGRLRLGGGQTPTPEELRAALPPMIDAALERLEAAALLLPAADEETSEKG